MTPHPFPLPSGERARVRGRNGVWQIAYGIWQIAFRVLGMA
jgi:hypothetical protein